MDLAGRENFVSRQADFVSRQDFSGYEYLGRWEGGMPGIWPQASKWPRNIEIYGYKEG